MLIFICDQCGGIIKDPEIQYETSDLEFDGPDNWYVTVELSIKCPSCGHVESIDGECIN